jgi:hypothetical protein
MRGLGIDHRLAAANVTCAKYLRFSERIGNLTVDLDPTSIAQPKPIGFKLAASTVLRFPDQQPHLRSRYLHHPAGAISPETFVQES